MFLEWPFYTGFTVISLFGSLLKILTKHWFSICIISNFQDFLSSVHCKNSVIYLPPNLVGNSVDSEEE